VIERALLSVWDKTGLGELAGGLAELGAELVASGGTAAVLEELGMEVTHVEQLTDVPELLGGRVKTLHPRIHAGILARRDRHDDALALVEHEISPFDLVCVNLYPFPTPSTWSDTSDAEAIELIDVGGPALLRAAAKNHAHVVAVCAPARYAAILADLREQGEISLETRRELAGEAFAHTAAYDARIAGWFSREEVLPEHLHLSLAKVRDLTYGENPHQRAALYAEAGTPHLLTGVEQLHGRQLSLTNLYDLATARALVEAQADPACAIVKHANPCGVAVAHAIEAAFERAFACDPVSAFGMACAVNRPVSAELGLELADRFVDVLHAPGYDEAALRRLQAKPGTRILAGGEAALGGFDLKRVPGGLLVQERDAPVGREMMEVVCGSVSEAAWADLLFAWDVCRQTTSNAIVLAAARATLGIGAGQVSRVDAVRIALEKARAHGHSLGGAVLASDGFFPFADGPLLALEAGVSTIVQPGGSKRDAEVVAAVEAAGAAMVFTGRRHFRH